MPAVLHVFVCRAALCEGRLGHQCAHSRDEVIGLDLVAKPAQPLIGVHGAQKSQPWAAASRNVSGKDSRAAVLTSTHASDKS